MKAVPTSLVIPLAFLALLLAGSPPLQADPVDNGIGLYTDLTGQGNSLVVETVVPFALHLLITHPVLCDDTTVFSWCWGCRITTSTNLTILSWEGQLCGANSLEPPDYLVCCPGSFPTGAAAVHLVTIEAVVTDDAPGTFYVAPFQSGGLTIDPLYSIWDGISIPSCFTWLEPVSGGFDEPLFVVNGGDPSPSEATTWGTMKTIYR